MNPIAATTVPTSTSTTVAYPAARLRRVPDRPRGHRRAVSDALEIGYRHIDTAQMYGNERGVGEAVRASGLDRAESSSPASSATASTGPTTPAGRSTGRSPRSGSTTSTCSSSTGRCRRSTTATSSRPGRRSRSSRRDGRARSIGVSNFQVDHLERLAAESDVVPAVNQIELHPYFLNDEVHATARRTASRRRRGRRSPRAPSSTTRRSPRSPTGSGRSPAQVVLRWHIQRGNIVFPKSTTPGADPRELRAVRLRARARRRRGDRRARPGEAGRTGANPDTFAYVPA